MAESRWYKVKRDRPQGLMKTWWLLLSVAMFLLFMTVSLPIVSVMLKNSYDSQVTRAKERANFLVSTLADTNVLTSRTVPERFLTSNQEYLEHLPYPEVNKDRMQFRVYDRSRNVIFSSMAIPMEMEFVSSDHSESVNWQSRQVYHFYGPIYRRDSSILLGYYQMVDYLDGYQNFKKQVEFWYAISIAIALGVSVAVSFVLVNILLTPIRRLSRRITSVDEENIHKVFIQEPKRRNEFSEIVYHLNHLLKRIAYYLDQQKRFVEDASHELRTPVAIVEGHLKLLNRWGKEDPEILDESLKASLTEIQRMKNLVQEMLDLQRADLEMGKYLNKTTEVSAKLTSIHQNFQMIHPDFLFFLHNDLSATVKAAIYDNHFEQILVILLDNAVKYSTNRKEVHLSASTDGRNVLIAVQDFGEGMSQEDQEKIFSRFYRVDKARSREKGGNGLGLSIAKQLIENYSGSIGVESVEKYGSIFRISIPIARHKTSESEQDKENRQVYKNEESSSQKKIDKASNRKVEDSSQKKPKETS
ncbi:sensor histidine kinase [Atopobacter sp. AH10]|uniref:sensor histidine kinase n=1 Tax=Atopobacter sp. AH10 TaxID=2315861 RepID=UPI000EF1A38C|nr:ATP-binding protein [Atopobacter sp. AH10]RLK63241.1 sensor histidine kinase [Atopobacter sp. AH10]